MELTSYGTLLVLALADSTSFGTLLIPIWLLLVSGRPRLGRLAAYLGTVAGFYFIAGSGLSFVARLFLDDILAWVQSTGGSVVMIFGGVLAFAAGLWMTRKKDPNTKRAGGGRLLAWRERAISAEQGSVLPLMSLALVATLIEIATLLPYLMAIGIMSTAELSPPAHLAVLFAYCIVMILPAVVLIALRVVAHRQVQPLLQKINDWLTKQAGDLTGWVLLLIGILLVNIGSQPFGGIGGLIEGIFGG